MDCLHLGNSPFCIYAIPLQWPGTAEKDMYHDHDNQVETIVKTLLQVGERVVEVSRDQVMTRIWERDGAPLGAFRSHYEGKKISEIRNDSTIAKCRELITEAFATGRNTYTEYVSHNNDIAAVLTLSLRVLACHPDKDYVFLVIDNISKGRENTLVEDRWKLALDASGHGVWDANMEEKTIFFSDKWEQLFGYGAKEITNFAQWSSKIHPDDVALAQKKMQDYIDGRSPGYYAEMRYLCKNGTYKWILSRGVVIERKKDGTPLRFIGTHVDISDRKRAELELRKAEEMFENSFHNSGSGKALIAPSGKWLQVNNVICELTGYTTGELMDIHYNDMTFPEDIGNDIPLIQKLLAKEIPSYTIEKRYVTKDRRVLSTVIIVTLVRDSDDQPKFFVCEVIDRTAQQRARDELKRKNQELETASANLLGRFNQLEELNHMIAHNLRGPARNIAFLSERSGIFPDEEALKMINEAGNSLLTNLDMMVEIARIKLDKEIQYDSCNLADIVARITSQLQGDIYQNSIKVIQKFPVSEISYPAIYLESILYNLISNAIKYRREDIEPTIQITTRTIDGKTQLSVKDNGLGIDLSKYSDKIFKLNQVFHQGHDSKGVGLFITKTQIESLGGTIEVKSKPNEGSEFIVTF